MEVFRKLVRQKERASDAGSCAFTARNITKVRRITGHALNEEGERDPLGEGVWARGNETSAGSVQP